MECLQPHHKSFSSRKVKKGVWREQEIKGCRLWFYVGGIKKRKAEVKDIEKEMAWGERGRQQRANDCIVAPRKSCLSTMWRFSVKEVFTYKHWAGVQYVCYCGLVCVEKWKTGVELWAWRCLFVCRRQPLKHVIETWCLEWWLYFGLCPLSVRAYSSGLCVTRLNTKRQGEQTPKWNRKQRISLLPKLSVKMAMPAITPLSSTPSIQWDLCLHCTILRPGAFYNVHFIFCSMNSHDGFI